MNITSTIVAYKQMLKQPTKGNELAYIDFFNRLRSDDKILCGRVQAKIIARMTMSGKDRPETPLLKFGKERFDKYRSKSAITEQTKFDAIVLIHQIEQMPNSDLDGLVSTLRKIAIGVDVFEECGACGPEIVKRLKRAIGGGLSSEASH